MSTASIPALLGGSPVRPEGPPDWPVADPAILEALRGSFADGSWGKYHGGNVERLEAALASYHGVAHALTCGSGTFAVELALRSLRIGPGDEVVLSAYDYPGNFLCVHAVGAKPVLVDVVEDGWAVDPAQLEKAIGPVTRALIVSHLHGSIVPMPDVMELAGRRQVLVIEDAAQMTGALVQGRKVGAWGDAGILSFGGSKLLTAGRGGALLTSHADVLQRARVVMNRGNSVCPLSELQAAVLLPQVHEVDVRNQKRAANVVLVKEQLEAIPGLRAAVDGVTESQPSYYKLGLLFDEAEFGLSRARFLAAMRAEGIAFDEGFRALHLGRAASRFRSVGPLPNAERAHNGVVILHHPVLLGNERDIEQVATAARKTYDNARLLAKTPAAT